MNESKNRLKMYGDDQKPSFLESKQFLWFRENSNLLFYVLLGLIALFIVIYKTGSYRSSKNESDYFTAEKEYQKIVKSLQDGEKNESLKDSFDKLQSILQSRPDLASKYEGILTQALLIEGDNKDATIHGNNVLTRIKKNDLSHYQNFSEITLLISNQELEKSLQKSLALKEELEKYKENSHDSFSYFEKLYAYNLLRIPFIQNQLKKNEEAFSSWKKIDEYLYASNSENLFFLEARNFLENLFSNQNISLKNYIQNQIQTFEKSINSK